MRQKQSAGSVVSWIGSMRVRLVLALLCLTCLSLAEGPSEKGLAAVRAMKVAAPRKWALVIGASDYPVLGTLKFARNDARAFAKALIEDYTFKPEDVTLLVDKDKPEIAPTAKNITSNLDRILSDKRLDRGDLFVFYFSGHGIGTKSGDYLCPTDTNRKNVAEIGLPVKEVMKRIVATGMKNVLVICDACRSGEKNPFGAELQQLGEKANIAVMLGCAPGRRSYEYPELNHGVFTHYLLKNMADRTARDLLSGSVWASALAVRVKEQVRAHTEPDHGEYAQTPASWNEKSQDVLLASFAPELEELQAFLATKMDSSRLPSKTVYGQVMVAMAIALKERGLPHKAIDLLKSVDQIGELTPRWRFLYAEHLMSASRYQEANRAYELLIATEKGFIRDAAILFSPSPKITPQQRAKAAEALWTADHDFHIGIHWLHFIESEVERRRVTGVLAKWYPKASKEGLYLAALLSQDAGRTEDASKQLWACVEAAGDVDVTHLALLELQSGYTATRDKNGELKVITAGIQKDTSAKFYWGTELASFYKSLKSKDRAVSLLKRLLESGEKKEPQLVLVAVDIAGLDAHVLVPEIQKLVDINPTSWQLQAALWLATNSKGLTPSFQFSEEMKRYAADPLELRINVISAIASMVSEMENLDAMTRVMFSTKFFISLAAQNKQFTNDPILWGYLLRYGEDSGRMSQLASLAEAKLFPEVLAGRASARSTETALAIAMSTGNDAVVDKIWRISTRYGAGKSDEAWKYLTYLLSRRRFKEAEAMLPGMPRAGDWVGSDLPAVVRAYLDAAAGKDTAKVKAALAAIDPKGIESMYLWTLANSLTGDAEQLTKFFSALLGGFNQSYLHLQAAGARVLWETAHKNKKPEDMAAVADLTVNYFGNPLFADITYTPDPKTADYAGNHKFSARFMDEGGRKRNGTATLQINVLSDGSVTGKMDGLEFKGSVDKYGTLTAAGTWDGDKIRLSTKMAPAGIYRSFGAKAPQPVLVLDENFESILMELRIAPEP